MSKVAYSHATSHAALVGRSTTRLISYVWSKRQRLGISRLTNLTPLDVTGIPVVAALRPSAKVGQITVCQGKSLRIRGAMAGALMEAVERFSCSEYNEIEHIPICAIDNSSESKSLVPACWGRSLMSGRRVPIHASGVIFPLASWKPGATGPRPSTSGLASGTTSESAIQSALLELVERTAVSRFYEGDIASQIDPNSLTNPSTRYVLERYEQCGIEVVLAHLGLIGDVTTVKVFALDTKQRFAHLAVTGQAADLDPQRAALRALLEAGQARVTAIQNSREDLSRFHPVWKSRYTETRELFDFVKSRLKADATVYVEAPQLLSQRQALEQTTASLHAAGFSDAFTVDLTHSEIALPVIRVFVPGLKDTFIEKAGTNQDAAG
jgi:thioglycine synthase